MPIETRETTLRTVKQKPGKAWAYCQTTDKGPWSGNMAEDLTPGTWIKAEGEWIKEGNFPITFVVRRVIQLVREKEDVGKAWLEWRLPEIGDVRAGELSERFGLQLPEVFESAQIKEVLASMRGLTPARVTKILAAYKDFPGELKMAQWLGEKGLKWAAIKASIEHYKSTPQLTRTVKEDPYTLMIVDGVTFAACDALGEGLGIPENDPRRLRGMVWEKLEELAGKSGDCYLPRADVMQKLSTFGYTPPQIENLLNESEHYQFQVPGLQLLRILSAERAVASRVRDMLEHWVQSELKLSDLPEWLDPSQASAVENLMLAPIAVLTGGPGTGKTTVLKTALDQMEARRERIRLASPTGKAAKRMTETTGRKAQTVHKLLEWKPEGWDRDATNPIEADVVVVDEASMLDIELAKGLFEAIGQGTRLILVGDVDQLPPVGPGQPLLDLMRSGLVPTFRLTKTHRQKKESWVIENAARILQGHMPSLTPTADFTFVKAPASRGRDGAETSAFIVQHAVAMYRQARSEGPDAEKQLQVLTPEHKKGAGTHELNSQIQKALNPNASDSRFDDQSVRGVGESKIFAGDKVFYTKNKPELGLVNGSMGVVEEIEVRSRGPLVRVRFDGEVSPTTGTETFELEDADIKPLMLAYAMTVHKAQGSEWSNVVVIADPAHWSMRRKLLYTAITRTNAKLTIIGTEDAVARGAKNNPDENRATLLQERLRGEPM